MEKPKIIIILGPTASGKTDLGIKLAAEFNGEIISADSKQVYKKMSIGTAKPYGKWMKIGSEEKYVVEGIPHHLVDIIDPGQDFSVADFKKLTAESIDEITGCGKIPIIVGGTGLYIWSIVENLNLPQSEANKVLRRSFEKRTTEDLAVLLSVIDPNADMVDRNNKRRLIRALEVAISTGESFSSQRLKSEPLYNVLQIGLKWPSEELNQRINKRIDEQWKDGLVKEVEGLVRQKYAFELSSMNSIGYKQVGYFLRGELTEEEAIEWLKRESRHYAKRQMTWFKRDKNIHWISRNDLKSARDLVKNFLQK